MQNAGAQQDNGQASENEETLSPILEVATGLALAIAGIAMSVSLAALLFRGELADGLPRAASSFVFGGGVISAIIAWRTQLRTAMATSQDLGAIVLLTTATSVAAGPAADPVVTMVVILAIAALGTGIAMYLIGRFGFSRIVRFLPSTVVMGFLAGTGWLLMRGGLEVMIDMPIELRHIGDLFGSSLKLWVPGVLVAAGLAGAGRIERIPSSAIGVFIVSAIALFYVIVALTSSVDAVGDGGWLVGPFDDSERWRPVSPTDLGDADWGEVGRSIIPMCAMAFVSIIGVLLNVTGLETISSRRVDLDNEIASAGIANILIAPLGGLIGFHMLGDTTLAEKAGIRGKRVPLAVGAISIASALFATSAAGYVPRFIVGGLILGVGLMLMVDWVVGLINARSGESLVSIAIVGVVMFFGMLSGVGFGIIAASVIFLYRYSKISPIRSEQSAHGLSSTVDRPMHDRQALAAHAEELRVLRAQGYLFFGSIEALHQRLQTVLDDDQVRCIILDFHQVDGVDMSARGVLARLDRDAEAREVVLLWSRMKPDLATELTDPTDSQISNDRVFDDIDRAIEAAEEILLAGSERAQSTVDLSSELAAKFERITFADGELVVRKGQTDKSIFIVEEGTCEAILPQPDGSSRRLRQFGQGSMFGDIGFRTGDARTADVLAIGPTTLLTLRRETYDQLVDEDPQLALELSHFLLDTTTRRIAHLTAQLEGELR